ncbi:MAG: GNAT family N-acetyltransferase [Chloroflexota bacterium]|nr:GNAT family N-acetyltransferase [Chloroflexota bacterium]
MDWKVSDLGDQARIMKVLERDRGWAAYAICDLSPPNRQFARFVGAWHGGRLESVVLLFQAPNFHTVLPCGEQAGIRAVMDQVEGLPETISLSVLPDDLPAVKMRYGVKDAWIMLRMVMTADEVVPARMPADIEIRRLDPSYASPLADLYQSPWGAVFPPDAMLEEGVYFGALAGETLVAVAGTHAISERFRIACVGGVFTDPAYRGRGLAQATTGAVVQKLAAGGIELIALNVRADNQTAVAAYRRLGFREQCRFWEGQASLLHPHQ